MRLDRWKNRIEVRKGITEDYFSSKEEDLEKNRSECAMRLKDRQGDLDEMELVMKQVVLDILRRNRRWRGG